MLASMTVTIVNPPDGASETLAATTTNTPAITWAYADGVLSLSGVASVADYLNVLKTIAYSDTVTSQARHSLDLRTITVVVNDGIADSMIATTVLTVV